MYHSVFDTLTWRKNLISVPQAIRLDLIRSRFNTIYSRYGVCAVICWQGSSTSPLCFDIIACCLTHPSFNHRAFPVAAARLWNTLPQNVSVCFQETFDHSFPRISCSAVRWIWDTIIDVFLYFTYLLTGLRFLDHPILRRRIRKRLSECRVTFIKPMPGLGCRINL